MKRFTQILALSLALFTWAFVPACVTNGGPPTREAIIFTSFKDTYAVARTAYLVYCEQVVSGKVAVNKERQADLMWNQFRKAFSVSFRAATTDWNAIATPEAQKLVNDFVAAIRKL